MNPLLLASAAAALASDSAVIRVNQVGYLPDAPKVAVLCSLAPASGAAPYIVRDGSHRTTLASRALPSGAFGPCAQTWRLDFSLVRRAGRYTIEARGATLRYLPQYSPDLNPIEMPFSKLKALLRKAAERTIPRLRRRIGRFACTLSAREACNYFRHAGYV